MVTVTQQQHQQQQDGNRYRNEKDPQELTANGHSSEDSPEDLQESDLRIAKRRITALVESNENENENESYGGSTQCSDVDELEEVDDEDGWVTDLPVSGLPQQEHSFNGLALPNADAPSFGDVCVKNSANVHLGNKTFYKGPVTIKQFVYTNPSLNGEGDVSSNGHSSDRTTSDNSATKSTISTDPTLSSHSDVDKVTRWLLTWRCVILLCTLALIFVTVIIVSVVILSRSSDLPSGSTFPEIPDSSIDHDVPIDGVRLVERIEWGAQPPTDPLIDLKLPVPYVIISHMASNFCNTQSECTFHVRFAQTFHIESRNWSDIAYNFLVGGDGLAYVGRGWNKAGAHSFGYNFKSIGISFIGTFNTIVPPKTQLRAARKLIELGIKNDKIAKNYTLLGHRQIASTLSPGDALYNIIKTWPHWLPAPPD